MSDRMKVVLQHLLPKQRITAFAGLVARAEAGPLTTRRKLKNKALEEALVRFGKFSVFIPSRALTALTRRAHVRR